MRLGSTHMARSGVYCTVMADDTFNASFYLAAAIVIPVLSIALHIELGKIRHLSVLILLITYIIVYVVSGFGELIAMGALYYKSATGNQGKFIFFIIGVLLIAIVVVPVIRFILDFLFPSTRIKDVGGSGD